MFILHFCILLIFFYRFCDFQKNEKKKANENIVTTNKNITKLISTINVYHQLAQATTTNNNHHLKKKKYIYIYIYNIFHHTQKCIIGIKKK